MSAVLNLLYSSHLYRRHCGYTAVCLTGVSLGVFAFPLKNLGSATLCGLTMTTGAEASKPKRHWRNPPLHLNLDSEFPVQRMLAYHRRGIYWQTQQSCREVVTLLICCLFTESVSIWEKRTYISWNILSYGVHFVIVSCVTDIWGLYRFVNIYTNSRVLNTLLIWWLTADSAPSMPLLQMQHTWNQFCLVLTLTSDQRASCL